ncbi:MAG: carboxypeptidase regulatory-like domain-containing protein [Candidatus Cloacimonetes bacterium]|nr:carboxypeptidase regulatory-like domain-containing protein [Candidatus Cloacimonadota bacterium]
MKKILFILFLVTLAFLNADIIINESFNNTTMPAGWTQVHEEGNVSWMTYAGGHNGNPAAPHSGTRNAYIFAETSTTKLVTPMLNIGGSTSGTLSFYYAHAAWAGSQDILRIYYKTEPDDDWNLIGTYANNITTWQYVSINLSGESSSYFIAFEAECHWGHGVVLDDVLIQGDPSPVGVVEGHVYSAAGIPLTGATVLIEDVSMSALSQPGGFYQILAVPQGTHSFFASLTGYGFDMTEALVESGVTTTIDFHLQEYVEVIVSGTVLSTDGGTPIQGALVELEGFADYEALTAANGQFIIPGVYSDNTYEVTISKPTFNPYNGEITLLQSNYNLGEISLIAPIDITGWVNTTATPGTGLSGATVVLSGYEVHTVQTAANGQFIIPAVYANENYTINVSYANHNPYQSVVNVDEDDIDLNTITLISPVSLTGHIVSTNNPEAGITGANVSLTGYATHSTVTDSLGDFFIEGIYANENYVINVTYPNHNTYHANVNIDQINVDLGTIAIIGPVTVSGYVYGSDSQTLGISGADVDLSGYANHSTTTDSIGYFAFTGVFANEDYDISVEATGYSPYENAFELGSIDLVLADIIVAELTVPAGNVHAEISDNSTTVTWNQPGNGIYEFRYDDGVPQDELGLNGPRAIMGARYDNNAVITQVKWYLTSAHSHNSTKVYIFGLNNNGTPNSGNLLYQSSNITGNYNNQWRTHILPTPVVAPNGFLVGICTPNQWTDVAMDDGDNEPWVFHSGTYYSTSDYQTGTWTDIQNAPNAGNLFIRANGTNLGPPLHRDFEGYQVFRLPDDEMADPSEWELVASDIQDTTYTDNNWWHLDAGDWVYGVRCQHTNGIYSQTSFSNVLSKGAPPTFPVNFYVYTPEETPLRYAVCTLSSFWHSYNSVSDINGLADYTAVKAGIYNLHVVHTDYADYDLEGVVIEAALDMDIYMQYTGNDDNQLTGISRLSGNFPNPFNPQTDICFQLAQPEYVTISIYNPRGQLVEKLCQSIMPAGEHNIFWNADNQPSGLYFIDFNCDSIHQIKKAVLLK